MPDVRDRAAHFEALHGGGDEPWSFSERGVETLRHARTAALVRALAPRTVLDVGCSLGQLTARLAELPAVLFAVDLSPTAAARARERLRARGDEATFVAAGATRLPFAASTFDVVLASDGLHSWQLDAGERAAALRELHDALVPGGHAVLTEHMRPDRFAAFVAEVRASPLAVVRVEYLHDRPCYQLEGLLKAVRHTRPARALRRSVPLARLLCLLGRPFGAHGSRHVVIVARREGSALVSRAPDARAARPSCRTARSSA